MKNVLVSKWTIFIILSIFMVSILPSCKSKKKCPDFTQVDGRVKVNKHGLAKKKKVKAPRSEQNF